jgi:Outer membrane protein beta-barrel domain
MKKIYLSIVALVAFGFANAQIKEKGTFEITPKIGASSFAESITNTNGNNGNTASISGVEFGVTADYYFNNRWSLRSGVVFDKMGSKTNLRGISSEDILNYISVPINANWHFGSTRKWNLNFGLSPSFLRSASYTLNGTKKEFPTNVINSFQLGITFGIGYKIEITKRFGILLDAQFFNGLTNLNNSDYVSGSYKNGGSSFNIGGVIQL